MLKVLLLKVASGTCVVRAAGAARSGDERADGVCMGLACDGERFPLEPCGTCRGLDVNERSGRRARLGAGVLRVLRPDKVSAFAPSSAAALLYLMLDTSQGRLDTSAQRRECISFDACNFDCLALFVTHRRGHHRWLLLRVTDHTVYCNAARATLEYKR